MTLPIPADRRGEHRYTSCFCEENAWHLCRSESREGVPPLPEERSVLFVTGHGPYVALWRQRAAEGKDPILWDYHVLVMARQSGDGSWEAWDLDSTLPCPVPLRLWLAESFRPGLVAAPLEPRFRVIPAPLYLETFSSDRSHMLDGKGRPLSPFPDWPPIVAPDGRSNLARFRDWNDPFVGERFDLAALARRYGGEPTAPVAAGPGDSRSLDAEPSPR
jgi:hypothetical protein